MPTYFKDVLDFDIEQVGFDYKPNIYPNAQKQELLKAVWLDYIYSLHSSLCNAQHNIPFNMQNLRNSVVFCMSFHKLLAIYQYCFIVMS